jgi:prepilin signal peptidase PulO-like enzyme (type II secretory pathway)
MIGASFGSFLNVVIYRVPLGKSVVKPRSQCPKCEKPIYWYENIPIISWIFLKAKCSNCKTRISAEYPIVEALCGAVTLFFFQDFFILDQIHFAFFKTTIFYIFLAHFVIDLRHKILPDSLNIYLGALLLAYAFVQFNYMHIGLGFLIGGGFPFLITWLFYKIRGQIGLGGGDIKLYAVLGLYLGPLDIMLTIFLSCFLGAIVGVFLIAFRFLDRKNPIPFGPFILIVATVQIFFPDLFNQVKNLIL